jgi:MinD superfamily P-loop ATPase
MKQLQIEIINTCIKCDLCREVCPESAVIYESNEFAIEQWACTYCQLCINVCPNDSIKISTTIKPD